MATAQTSVSALVVTYEHEHEVAECVDAALAQSTPGLDMEVVVVDNASTDGTIDVLRRYGDRITLVALEENTGYAAGVNAAFAASSSERTLLLNPDAVMDPACVAALSAHLDRDPKVGAAAALLRDPDGSPQRFARRDVGLAEVFWNFTALGSSLDARRGARHARRREYADEWERGLDAPLAVDCPAAACVLVRRELLEPLPLEPELPLFFNDAELWRRLRADGWRIEVVPDAGALHGAGTSIRRTDRVRIRAEWVAAVRRYLRPVLGPFGRAVLYTLFLADAVGVTLADSVRRRRPSLPNDARGTLGGLGLPGGAKPWLTPVRRVGRRARAAH